MAGRYFVEPPVEGARVILGGPEAHHLIHVMRARPGRRVVLFDGSGAEFPSQVETIMGRDRVELAVLAREEVDRELPFGLTLGVALPKGDRRRWLVEKAVELGVRTLVPLITGRSATQPAANPLRRFRRHVIEASKQCGRNRLMEIAVPTRWPDFVANGEDSGCRLLAHPASRTPDACPLPAGPLPEAALSGDVHLAVGPEGGFTAEEYALAVSGGWQPVDLGPRILRTETAAVFLAVLVASRIRGQ